MNHPPTNPAHGGPHSTRALVIVLLALLLVAQVWHLLGPVGSPATRPARATGQKIDLNMDDADTLCLLPGIGPGIAQRIIDYRQAHGPFRVMQDLRQVPGLGERTVARLEPLIKSGPARSDEDSGPSQKPTPTSTPALARGVVLPAGR